MRARSTLKISSLLNNLKTKKRITTEQIVTLLRQIEVLTAQGKARISQQTATYNTNATIISIELSTGVHSGLFRSGVQAFQLSSGGWSTPPLNNFAF
jgi:hypothetical protein